MDAHNEEVDKPGERVLVHRVDVGQVSDGEEQDTRMLGDRTVTHPGRLDLLLRLLSDLASMTKKCYISYKGK